MYIGNGVTKKFPIPSGYDGSVVILKMPNGSGYRMLQGDAYYIQDGYIIFNSAVPAGIEITFDLSDAAEIVKSSSKNYVVIHSDGTIEEVNEDPDLILEEAKNLLIEAKKQAAEAAQALDAAQKYIANSLSSTTADLDGRLDGYAKLAQEAISEAAKKTGDNIKSEWAASLDRILIESKSVREDLTQLQKLKRDIQDLQDNSLNIIKQTANDYIEKIAKDCEEIRKIKPELDLYKLEIKKDFRRIVENAAESMKQKVNQQMEELNSMKAKAEENFNTLNTKINNRWDLLRGRLDG